MMTEIHLKPKTLRSTHFNFVTSKLLTTRTWKI